jgi:hypothetical protein
MHEAVGSSILYKGWASGIVIVKDSKSNEVQESVTYVYRAFYILGDSKSKICGCATAKQRLPNECVFLFYVQGPCIIVRPCSPEGVKDARGGRSWNRRPANRLIEYFI